LINNKNKYAVILLNMGGPDSLDTIEPFLYNLFQDPDIFKIPFGQKIFAKLISKLRTKKVVEQYKQIGNAVPVNLGTEVGYTVVKFLNEFYTIRK